jgi:prepilin-type N-terminal cleavage/methylation domain-containing protein
MNISSSRHGFTIIELTIGIAILGTIMAATVTMFVTGLKNYESNSQKSSFQKELNYTIDSIANDIKNGAGVAESYGGYTTSSDTLVVALPATSNDDFIYTGETLEQDYIVYYLDGGTVRKHTFGNALGDRSGINGNDSELLKDVSSVNFEYSPGISSASQIKITMTLARQTGKVNVHLTESRTANLRNKQ